MSASAKDRVRRDNRAIRMVREENKKTLDHIRDLEADIKFARKNKGKRRGAARLKKDQATPEELAEAEANKATMMKDIRQPSVSRPTRIRPTLYA